MTGWFVRDLAQRVWSLDELGTIAPGQEVTISRNGQPMAMNNRGDTIELFDSSDALVQTITYGNTVEGEEIVVTQD